MNFDGKGSVWQLWGCLLNVGCNYTLCNFNSIKAQNHIFCLGWHLQFSRRLLPLFHNTLIPHTSTLAIALILSNSQRAWQKHSSFLKFVKFTYKSVKSYGIPVKNLFHFLYQYAHVYQHKEWSNQVTYYFQDWFWFILYLLNSLGPQAYCICLLYTCTIFKQGNWMAGLKFFTRDDLCWGTARP